MTVPHPTVPSTTPSDRVDADWRALAASVVEDVRGWRRHLHQNAELSFQEVETTRFIEQTLRSFGGFDIERPTETGLIARLKGGKPGPVLAVRADMDALPIQEASGEPFASANPGVMHACGHDGHTAILLGVAKLLSARRDGLHGELRFLFQHAEEMPPGGAVQLVAAGALEGVDNVIGLHLISHQDVGTVALRSGPTMAAPDTFEVTVVGKGGHAAYPHETVDPIAVGAQVVTNLQHVVSRMILPIEPAVVSVTRFHAGAADNVIENEAVLGGTVRTFSAELRRRIPELMERVVKGITSAHGADYRFTYERGYQALVNDDEVTERLRAAFVRTFGEGPVVEAPQTMGGEDFSAYLAERPGTFFYIGARAPTDDDPYPHHHPKFVIDEDGLEMGVTAFLAAIEELSR